MVKSRRNEFYLFVVIIILFESLYFIVEEKYSFLAEYRFAVNIIQMGCMLIFLFLGYRVANISCHQCGNKLAIGQFFFLRNVRCWGCGFKYGGT